MEFSVAHLVVVLLVVLVVFGAGRLPKVMGDLGKGVRSFKDGLNDNPADKTVTTLQAAIEPPELTHQLTPPPLPVTADRDVSGNEN